LQNNHIKLRQINFSIEHKNGILRYLKYSNREKMENLSTFISANLWLSLGFVLLLVVYLAFEIAQKKNSAKSVTTQEAITLSNREKGIFLDVRDGKEYNNGHIVGALNTSISSLKESTKFINKHKQTPVIIYAELGQHANSAYAILTTAGFEKVSILRGGLSQWKVDGLPTEKKS
jgi:thiosulfate/3-mercaptopyruvate sulfurtransferase